MTDRVLLWSEIDLSGGEPERVYFWFDFESGRCCLVWDDHFGTEIGVPKNQSIVTFWNGL